MEVQDILDGMVARMRDDAELQALLPSMDHEDSAGDPVSTLNVWSDDYTPSGAPRPVVMCPLGPDLNDEDAKNGTGVLEYFGDIFVIGPESTSEALNKIASRIRFLFNRKASSITIANHIVLIAKADGPHEAANVANDEEIARAVNVRLTMEDA